MTAFDLTEAEVEELTLRLGKVIFGCEPICLTGAGERDREVTVDEYPIADALIEYTHQLLSEVCKMRGNGYDGNSI